MYRSMVAVHPSSAARMIPPTWTFTCALPSGRRRQSERRRARPTVCATRRAWGLVERLVGHQLTVQEPEEVSLAGADDDGVAAHRQGCAVLERDRGHEVVVTPELLQADQGPDRPVSTQGDGRDVAPLVGDRSPFEVVKAVLSRDEQGHGPHNITRVQDLPLTTWPSVTGGGDRVPVPMVKLVYCVRKRDDVDPEEFSRYWLDQHGPLVRSVRDRFPMARYVQSHTLHGPATDLVRASRGGAEPFDGITEVWFSAEDLERGSVRERPRPTRCARTRRGSSTSSARWCSSPRSTRSSVRSGDWAVRGLDRARRRRLLWISLAAWLVSGLAMLPLNAWLSDHGAPIIEFEFAREDAARYLDQWGDGTWRATVSLLLDYPFLLGYGVGSALLLLLVRDALERRDGRQLATAARIAAWLPLAGAAFDAVENAFLLVVITRVHVDLA